jgi:hypothetical protein
MADTNKELVGRALELVVQGLGPFVDRRMREMYGPNWSERFVSREGPSLEDPSFLFRVLIEAWDSTFRSMGLKPSHRSLVFESRDVRNSWAHNGAFNDEDTLRALDSMQRLLFAALAPECEDIKGMKNELMRRAVGGDGRNPPPPTSRVAAPMDREPSREPQRPVPPSKPIDLDLCPWVAVFSHDEIGFVTWRDSHPSGYIVNCHRQPQPDYVKLHRPTCWSLNKPWTYTRDYIKLCAESKQRLIECVMKLVGGGPDPCPFCKP